MLPQPANCPLCATAAERLRSAALRGYKYTCPKCGTFGIESGALGLNAMPLSAPQDLARLRAYGHLPCVQRDKQGVRIGPGKA